MSVRCLTDETGAVTDKYLFDAFGNKLVQEGSTDNEYGFQGEQQDATGLYYLRARYMDPASGTFTSMDTYGGTTLYKITIPEGSSISGLEGRVGTQGMGLYGGAHQVYLDYRAVPSDWIEITPDKLGKVGLSWIVLVKQNIKN